MIIAYCMTHNEGLPRLPEHGVRNSPVSALEHDGLACIYSELVEYRVPSENDAKNDALQFHSVVQKVFTSSAVIPFRFPTLLDDPRALTRFLEKHGAQYRRELDRLNGRQEMKIELQAAVAEMRPSMSGTEFLRAKYDVTKTLDRFASSVMAEAYELECEWKRKDNKASLVLLALVAKDRWHELRRRVLRVCEQEKLPARVTGPWPPGDFVDWYPEVE